MSFLESDPTYRDPDDALRELLEHEHLILEMQATPGWPLWKDWVVALLGRYQDRLLSGNHSDLMKYKYDAGVVAGIKIAIGASQQLHQSVSALRETVGILAEMEEQDVIA